MLRGRVGVAAQRSEERARTNRCFCSIEAPFNRKVHVFSHHRLDDWNAKGHFFPGQLSRKVLRFPQTP